MLLVLRDDQFLAHATPAGHPECPARYRAVERALADAGLAPPAVQYAAPRMASAAALARVHHPGYLERLERFCAAGGGSLDPDTHVVEASWTVACLAAGAALDGVRHVWSGAGRCAFCITRPPGHHARPDAPMGFCIFNNIAVGAAAALAEYGAERVLIVDWDLHHGNGTQEAFYEDPRIFYFSMHRFPFWPGSGGEREEGRGPGLGFTLNLPLEEDTPRAEIRLRFRRALEMIAARFSPRLVLLSAGFDMHRQDPLGGLSLEASDFGEMTHEVAEVFLKTGALGIVSCLEGGYHLEALAQSAASHVKALYEIDAAKGH